MKIRSLFLSAVAAITVSASANTLGVASAYDVFVKDNLRASGAHVHGSSAIGGDLVLFGNMSEFGNKTAENSGPALVVKGTVQLGADARVNGSKHAHLNSLTVGQTVNSQGVTQSGRSLYAQTVNVAPVNIDFDGAFADLRLLSQTLAGLSATVNANTLASGDTQNRQLNLGFNPGAGFEVLNLTVAEFVAFKNIQVSAAAANTKSWIINVDLTTYNGTDIITQNRNGNDDAASRILWNFYGADSLFIANQFYGSILAPDLAFTHVSNDFKGQVIVESFNKPDGQVHIHRYTGDLPPVKTPPPVSVPDSGSTLLLLLAAVPVFFAVRFARR